MGYIYSRPGKFTPPMEARYFSGFKSGPYKQLIALFRNATKNRAFVSISFIGKSILEIVTPNNEADGLVIGLEAICYRHLSKFDPTTMLSLPLRSCMPKREKGKIFSLPLAALKGQRRIATHIGQPSGTNNKRNAYAILLFAYRLSTQC